MKKWELKSLPTSGAAIVMAAQAAIGIRAHANSKAKREGASIMAVEAGIATLPARDLVKEGASGRTDQSNSRSGFRHPYAELCFATTHTFAY
jgi:hypothetical protein